ncbi:MAG: preprotein translocase subunit SecE [Gammaproteobacteria bacterium]|nr:preprotein translocase subunit SecE [Gammaproteobacteria bacterium]
MAFNPAKFMRDVRNEAAKTTWPSRRETLTTTGLVLAMVAVTIVFFVVVDQVIGVVMQTLFGIGS